MLSSTEVAGRPESYFRRQDAIGWAARWGICGPDGNVDLADYFQAATEAGKTPNGVFAVRVMWGTSTRCSLTSVGSIRRKQETTSLP